MSPDRGRTPLERWFLPDRSVWRAIGALVSVLVLGCLWNADGAFFALGTHLDALWFIAPFGILACGLTVVIISGGIDLSVGSLVALSGVVFYLLLARHEVPGPIAAATAIGIASVCGVTSGLLVGFARVPPFIATLGMMAFARGLAKSPWTSDNVKITQYPDPSFVAMLNARIPPLGTPLIVPVFAVAAACTWFFLRRLVSGTRTYAIGDNERAAVCAGVPVRRVKLLAYSIGGLMAGLAGVFFAALERQGNPDGGTGYELTAIAIVVVGGTSLAGGSGGASLTVLGTLTIGYIRKILDINAVETSTQNMIFGAIVVGAALMQSVRPSRR
ncbi:MAG: ABC transporter permease [Phycisphaerae bacterium]|nr:ABC transporter permease [Phycisphaerae bacterium]